MNPQPQAVPAAALAEAVVKPAMSMSSRELTVLEIAADEKFQKDASLLLSSNADLLTMLEAVLDQCGESHHTSGEYAWGECTGCGKDTMMDREHEPDCIVVKARTLVSKIRKERPCWCK